MDMNTIYTSLAYHIMYNKWWDILSVYNDLLDDPQATLRSILVLTNYNNQTAVPAHVLRYYPQDMVDIDGKGV